MAVMRIAARLVVVGVVRLPTPGRRKAKRPCSAEWAAGAGVVAVAGVIVGTERQETKRMRVQERRRRSVRARMREERWTALTWE